MVRSSAMTSSSSARRRVACLARVSLAGALAVAFLGLAEDDAYA